jgi:hypothetical protein
MKFEIGAMTVGDILDRGLKIFWARLPTFYAINLIVLAPMLLYAFGMVAYMANMDTGQPSPEALLGLMVANMGLIVLVLILAPIGAAASLHVIGQEFIDERVGVGEALSFALRRFGSLLGVTLLVGLTLTVGFCLLVVPFFIFWTWYAFASQVVVMEGLSGMAALNRSQELGKDFFWRILGVLLLMVVIQLIASFVNNILTQVVQPFEIVPGPAGPRFVLHSVPLYLLVQTVNFLLGVAVQSYSAVCITLLYFDLRIRKEGFDLDLAARQHKRGGAEPGAEEWPPQDRHDQGIRHGKEWPREGKPDEGIRPGDERPEQFGTDEGIRPGDEGPGTL